MTGNYIMQRLVDALDADIFTDAPECQPTIEAMQSIACEAREFLKGQPPIPTVRIWHGSFDGENGTLTNVATSKREFEDWLLHQVGQDRSTFDEWYGDLPATSPQGLDDFLREHSDCLDSWAWDYSDVAVPGLGRRPRVVVALDGGLVSGASSDVPVDMVVVDYDVEGASEDEIVDLPQSDSAKTEDALIRRESVDVDPGWTNEVFAVEGGKWPDGHDNAYFEKPDQAAAEATFQPLPYRAHAMILMPDNKQIAEYVDCVSLGDARFALNQIVQDIDLTADTIERPIIPEPGDDGQGSDEVALSENDPAAVIIAGLDLLDGVPWAIPLDANNIRFLALDSESDEPRVFRAHIIREQ